MIMMKNNIIKVADHCCGCGICATICPVRAITMQENRQGFYYPEVNEKVCIDCGKCLQRCAFNADKTEENKSFCQEAFALKHCDESVRAESRSGGVFTAITDLILECGGVVYGCVLEDNRNAVHIRATTRRERDRLRGSKYIQSKTFDVWERVKNDLKHGLWVLFSGTPCQVDAVRSLCADINCEKLLLVDIVCHGVPSPKVWSNYLDSLTKKHGKKIISVDFRDKRGFGWAAHVETVEFEDGTAYSGDVFKKLFYDHYILRRDCFTCPYKNLQRTGDISIADCWGIRENYPDFFDDKGISLVLVNTEKGQNFFSQIQRTTSIPVDIQKMLQPPLRMNWNPPADYDKFWRFYYRHSFNKVVDKYVQGRKSIPERALGKVRRTLGRMYRWVFRR